MRKLSNTINILTIDLEDYFQVENLKEKVKFSDWEKYECRVVKNTDKILDILGKYGTEATFFVLGWLAERYPELVKNIYSAGHEIASHGYAHNLIYEHSQEDFRADLRRSKNILEGIIAEPVIGYRAPSYSITNRSVWALDILMEEGFKYDSSIFPIYHDLGGLPDAKRYPNKIYNHKHEIIEIPLSTVKIAGRNIPFSGGGYFRLLPYGFIRWATKQMHNEGYPAVIYLHPWEFDREQPRIKAGRIKSFRHYVNLHKTEEKFKKLLNDFKFTSIKNFIKDQEETIRVYEEILA